jgi:Tol biopolymer transport system component
MTRTRFFILIAFLLVIAVAIAGYMRWQMKQGRATPPPPGQAVVAEKMANASSLPTGFVVWSSNRYGNHEILRMDLPEKKITRVTNHPHTEYYPRISPDGTKIVFARSQKPWVSQRNTVLWDAVVKDLETGEERVVARNANQPTWSADGKKIYFQYKDVNVAEVDLETGEQKILLTSGTGETRNGASLYTPNYNAENGKLAVTQHIGDYAATIVDMDGKIQKVGWGCQITWNKEGTLAYHVGHGGKQKNAFYLLDTRTGKYSKWLELPGEYSHEYFPKMSNDEKYLVFAASSGGHEHDSADYEIFLWRIGDPADAATRLTFHTGNDNWPDIYLK